MATAYFEIVQWSGDERAPDALFYSYRSKTLALPNRTMALNELAIYNTVSVSERAWIEEDGIVRTIKDRAGGMIGQKPDMTEKEWFLLKLKSTPL